MLSGASYGGRLMGSLQHRYTHALDTVFAKVSDGEHLRRRSEASGHLNIQLSSSSAGGVVEIRLERDIESSIPSFAKRFINPVNHVVDVIRWRDVDGVKKGTYDVTVSSRIRVRGEMTLEADGDGCLYTDTCTPSVDMPLIGKKISKLVSEETVKAIKEDCRFTEREISAG